MNLFENFMRVFFDLLYHSFAFAYDFVAATVSFGQWKNWIASIALLIDGTYILELGHGTGYLQRILLDRGLVAVAIDESAPMGRLARRRLGSSHKLNRALAQKIPFAAETFDTVVSTFPSEYIFDKLTLSEAHRVLRSGGRFVVLLAAWPRNPLLGWLFRVAGQSPSETFESIKSEIMGTFAHADFKMDVQLVEVKSGKLLVIIAKKQET
jgi:ubiquinone/menaquinone biosynthesis C-methylase UbiE